MGHHMVLCSDGRIRAAYYSGLGCGEFVIIDGIRHRNGDNGITWYEDDDEDDDE